jgi:HEAT repeat protein
VHSNEEVRRNCALCLQFDLDEEDLQNLALDDDSPVDAVIALLSKMKRPPDSSLALFIKGLFSDDFDTRETDAPRGLKRLGDRAALPVTDVALDMANSLDARCAALQALAQLKPLPEAAIDGIRSLLPEHGKLGSFAALALANQGQRDQDLVDKIVAGVAAGENGFRACAKGLPEAAIIPAAIAQLRAADMPGKQRLATLLGEVGYREPAAAQAVVDEFVTAADDTLRNRLANALRNFEELAVPPALVALAEYSSDEQIIRLMEGLEFLGPDASAAIPALLPLLEHANPEVGFYVAKAIAAIDPSLSAIVPHLLRALTSANLSRRYEAMNRIEWMGEFAAPYVDQLIELLDDEEFRCSAAHTLGSIGTISATAIPKLAELMYVVDHESVVASDAVDALGRTGHPDAAAHLLAALDNEGKLDDVIQALKWMPQHAEIFLDKLRAMLNGPYRLKAVTALGEFGEAAAAAAPDVIALLDDSDGDIRMAAIRALEELEAGAEQLMALAKSGEAEVRLAALEGLGGPRPAEAIPLLMEAAASEIVPEAKAAMRALSRYRERAPAEFLPLVMRRLDEGKDDFRWAAIDAIQNLGPLAHQATSRIVPLLTNKDCYETAFNTIEAIGPPAARDALPELERLTSSLTHRSLARRAIWALSPQRARELHLKPTR